PVAVARSRLTRGEQGRQEGLHAGRGDLIEPERAECTAEQGDAAHIRGVAFVVELRPREPLCTPVREQNACGLVRLGLPLRGEGALAFEPRAPCGVALRRGTP